MRKSATRTMSSAVITERWAGSGLGHASCLLRFFFFIFTTGYPGHVRVTRLRIGSCSGNPVENRVVFGFNNSTRLIIGSGSC
jgi:hypothetical protein